MRPQIKQIRVKNFKLYKELQIKNLQRLNVFLGANGTGQTTLFKIFGFLATCLKDNATVAVNREGGFKEVITRGVNSQTGLIEFEIKFRNLAETSVSSPLVTYELKIGLHAGKTVVIEREILKYRRGQYGKPWHFLDYFEGIGSAIKNETDYGKSDVAEEREEQPLGARDILALKGLGQFERYHTIRSFKNLLEHWLVINLQNEEMRRIGEVGADQQLSASGGNLAQVASYIYQYHPEMFQIILEKMKKRVPGIDQVEVSQNEAGQLLLKFKDNTFIDPFIAKYASDGTIKMFAYLVLLHDPTPRPLLCIEEPENYLYPSLLAELADELREYAIKGGQVFVSTHSPDFVNALKIEELFLVKKVQGVSQILPATTFEQVKELYDNGCQLGWLWQHKYFDGIEP